jgi:predicted O-linked N-acetylglucosamine transferase (SPINDLY family)
MALTARPNSHPEFNQTQNNQRLVVNQACHGLLKTLPEYPRKCQPNKRMRINYLSAEVQQRVFGFDTINVRRCTKKSSVSVWTKNSFSDASDKSIQ